MKRSNTWADAVNTGRAVLDLGDGLSMRLPLGDMDAAIGDAADAAKAAAIEASLGPKVISYDPTTGRPYWDASTGTHRIFTRYDGRPYAALLPDITTTTPSGRPALDL